MRLSEVAEKIFEAIEEKGGEYSDKIPMARGVLNTLLNLVGDLELNLEVRVIPPGPPVREAQDVTSKEVKDGKG
jgi:hypothetical protein